MPFTLNRTQALAYLQRFMTGNKARGMVAEQALETEILALSDKAQRKILSGGWLLSPKVPQAYRNRYISFVLPEIHSTPTGLTDAIYQSERRAGWQTCATFLEAAAIGITVTAPYTDGNSLTSDVDLLRWKTFVYQDEHLIETDVSPFAVWPGGRGRASHGSPWPEDVLARYEQISDEQLTALTLRQAFFYGYIKQALKLPLYDPYDVDAFVVSYAGAVMPIEIKEKSRTPQGEFGLDVGRILMMLRLCLATDSNALYLIREVDGGLGRPLIGWKYMALSDIIMMAQWNAQGGGASMTGGGTQTVMMPAEMFRDFDERILSEENLRIISTLSQSIQVRAKDFADTLGQYLR